MLNVKSELPYGKSNFIELSDSIDATVLFVLSIWSMFSEYLQLLSFLGFSVVVSSEVVLFEELEVVVLSSLSPILAITINAIIAVTPIFQPYQL